MKTGLVHKSKKWEEEYDYGRQIEIFVEFNRNFEGEENSEIVTAT